MFQIQIKVRFRAGHRLMEPYIGKCNNPHGEGYTAILIFEKNNLDENGMVLDFGKVKKEIYNITNQFYDHTFMFNKDDKKFGFAKQFHETGFRIYLMEGNPTAENIAKDLFMKVKKLHPELKRVGIIESFDDSIAWYEEENLDDLIKVLDKQNLKDITKDFSNRLIDLFKGIKLDINAPEFKWKDKVCEECEKPIPGFSEFCLFHYKGKRFFCSKKCLIGFVEKYKRELIENDME